MGGLVKLLTFFIYNILMADDYETRVDMRLGGVKEEIANRLNPFNQLSSPFQQRMIIGTYTLAIEPNFIQWMRIAKSYVKSSEAVNALSINLQDEINQDHRKMLRDFAQGCGFNPGFENYSLCFERAMPPVLRMWEMFAKGIGIRNLAAITILEYVSPVFIPYLEEMGKRLGCTDFTYTKIHGEADIEHSMSMRDSLMAEIAYWRNNKMGNPIASGDVDRAIDTTSAFLTKILTP